IHINGKQVWRSTRSKRLEVAKRRMKTILEEERDRAGFVVDPKDKMTVQDAVEHRERQLDNDPSIKESTRHYWRQCHKALLASWPGLDERDLGSIRRQECED